MKSLNQTLRTILFILAAIGTATTALAYDMVVNGVYYNINGNEAYVTYITYSSNNGYNYSSKYSGHVTIPEVVTYNGLSYTVTGIGQHAFENCTNLTSVTIPNTITSIDYCTFYNCTGLINISIPNSVTSIDSGSFSYCRNLTSINIPNSVASLGVEAFYNCI